jgi:hypothetical protein
MAKPNYKSIKKSITMHPEVKDKVVEFAKQATEEVLNGNNKTKNIAVITPRYVDFNIYKLSNGVTGNNQNFIHVSRLNEVDGIVWNDYVKLTTRIKMPDVDKIIKKVISIIDNHEK